MSGADFIVSTFSELAAFAVGVFTFLFIAALGAAVATKKLNTKDTIIGFLIAASLLVWVHFFQSFT